MGHPVKCFYCGHTFDRDRFPFVAIPNKVKRYAHKECYEKAINEDIKEQEDKEKLEEYIKNLFGYKTLPEKVNKQIRKFHIENNYSYSAIYKTLIYFFDIKKNTIEKANGGIGIVPYINSQTHPRGRAKNICYRYEKFIFPLRNESL